MTTVYVGPRVDILKLGSWDEVADYDRERFEVDWCQVRLVKRTRIVFDAPASVLSFLAPHPHQDIALTELDATEEKAWRAWCRRYQLDLRKLPRLTLASIRDTLVKGVRHLQFTADAVEWFINGLNAKALTKTELNYRLVALLLTFPQPKTLTAVDVATALGGTEGGLAAKILERLGNPEAVALAARTPADDAVRLFDYLGKALENRETPWLLFLKICRKGADDKRYDYRTAIVIFTLCCLHTSKSTPPGSVSSATIDQTLDLYRISGIPCSIPGGMTAFF